MHVFKRRSVWISEVCEGRKKFGEYHHLFPVLRRNEKSFFEYTRMSTLTFDYILEKISPEMVKQETNFRNPISAEEMLVVTLRYLATGSSFTSMAFSFRMGASTVRQIVLGTCKILWEVLIKDRMPVPTTELLENTRSGYWNVWNFPNCVGAVDGKHCRINCPPKSGSLYYNYKKFFSVVLQAVADHDYKFLTVEVGAKGSQNDGGTFAVSALGKALQNKTFNMPPDTQLPSSTKILPNVIIGDEAYPLKTYLLKPYARQDLTPAKTNFNYRLSRARRCVECAFGILYAKWRILSKSMETNVKNAEVTIKCACLLHNVIRDRDGESDPLFREIRWNGRANDGQPLHRHKRNNRHTTRAQRV